MELNEQMIRNKGRKPPFDVVKLNNDDDTAGFDWRRRLPKTKIRK